MMVIILAKNETVRRESWVNYGKKITAVAIAKNRWETSLGSVARNNIFYNYREIAFVYVVITASIINEK